MIDNVRTVASTYETYYENHLLLYTELFETGKVLKAELGALFEPTNLLPYSKSRFCFWNTLPLHRKLPTAF